MNYINYLNKYTHSLKNKNVVITGATGGLGKNICYFLAKLDANLILVSRDINKLNLLKEEIKQINNTISIKIVICNFEDINTCKECCDQLNNMDIDYLINNAGAYHIPNKITSLGYNNIFQINFIVPFYMTKRLEDKIKERHGKVITVNSIAHTFTKLDKNNIEFKNKKPIGIYANSKRFELLAIQELIKEDKLCHAFVHPGISFTNITSGYPKFIKAIIKYPMKVIFISPKKAALAVIRGMFEDVNINYWIGPKFFNIWGKPSIKRIKTSDDSVFIYQVANDIYKQIEENF